MPEDSTLTVRHCETCGKPLPRRKADTPKRYAQKRFCSAACHQRSRKRPDHTCPVCGTVFATWRPTHTYCSRSCRMKDQHRVRQESGQEHVATWVPITCAHCGQTRRYRSSSLTREGRGNYCSRVCKDASQAGWVPLGWGTHAAPPTSIETEVYAALTELGVEFEPQKFMGRFKVDALLRDRNLVIEVHGDYWHTNPEIYPDGPSTAAQIVNARRDAAKQQTLSARGYRVVVLWERDIRAHGALSLLREVLREHHSGRVVGGFQRRNE